MMTRSQPPVSSLGAVDLGTVDVVDLVEVLTMLEDFLLHADADLVDQLAGYRRTRPDDPPTWVRWVAGLLGEHAARLRAPTTSIATTTSDRIGEPR
jgi:hypothetical protein